MTWPLAIVLLGALALVGFLFYRATEPDEPDPTQAALSRYEPEPEETDDE